MSKLKNADRRLLTILLIVFVGMAGAAMILPVLPIYAKNQFQMSPEVITLLFTSFFGAQFVAGPYLGRLSDRYGRVPVLIISQIGTAISFIMMAMAQNVEMLFIARILDGITGGNLIVAQAYITDIMPDNRRTEALGYVFAMFGLGFIVGPALGGVLSAVFGPHAPFYIAAIAAAFVVILTWFTLNETLSPEQRRANRKVKRGSLSPVAVLTNAPLMLILVVSFVGQFGLGQVQSTFALYGEAVLFKGYSEQQTSLGVGLLLATVGMGQFITQMFLLRRLLRRYGDLKLAILGSILRALAMFGLAVILSPWLAGGTAALFAVGSGLMMPPLQSLSTRTVGPELRGGVLGWYQSAVSLATIFSTALGGYLFSINPTTPYWLSGTLFVIATMMALYLLHWSQTHQLSPTVTSA